jgi:hypothetical protein
MNLLPLKVIQECIEYLKKDSNEIKIILLYQLIKGIFNKFKEENLNELEKALFFLEKKM